MKAWSRAEKDAFFAILSGVVGTNAYRGTAETADDCIERAMLIMKRLRCVKERADGLDADDVHKILEYIRRDLCVKCTYFNLRREATGPCVLCDGVEHFSSAKLTRRVKKTKTTAPAK